MLISARRLKIVISVLLLLVITFAAFYPALKNAFNYDDDIYIKENRFIKSLSLYNVEKIFTSLFGGNYQPVSVLTYLFEYRFFGLNPRPYHLTNIILHSFNCLLVFWLFYLIGGRVLGAWIVSILFAIHPLRVESVAWVSERKDVVYAFFFLYACIVYVYYLKDKGNKKFYYLALIAFILSLLSKSMAVTLPLVLFIFDYLLCRKLSKGLYLDKVPFFILSLFFGIITIFSQYSGGGIRQEKLFSLCDKIMNAGYGAVFYLHKIFLPSKLACLYPLPDNTAKLASLLLSVALSALILIYFKKTHSKKIIFGCAFFLVTILPVLQFIPLGSTLASDRYSYIPSLGIFYLISEAFIWLVELRVRYVRAVRILLFGALIVAVGILSCLTCDRCKVWKDGISLWSDVLNKYPSFVTALNNRGNLFAMDKEYDLALIDFKKAVSIKSGYKESRNAYLNLAALYFQTGKAEEAIVVLQEALNKFPNDAELFYNLGIVYSFINKETAVAYYKKAIKFNPFHAIAYYNLGVLYIELGDTEDAVSMLKKTIEINPEFTAAYAQLAKLYNNPARKEELVSLYKKAIRRNLEFLDAYYYIGNLYYESGRDREAMALYKRALQINPKR